MEKIISVIGLILIASLFVSCVSIQPASVLTKENNEIDSSLRNQIKTLNTQILTTVQKADFEGFFGYFATNISDETKIKQQLQDVFPSMTKYVTGKNFGVDREYYSIWQGNGNTPAIVFPKDDNDFRTSVDRVGNEMFTFFGANNDFNQSLISMIYTKQNGNWKLVNCNISSYKIDDKNSPQWYKEAIAEYDKGYLITALFRVQLAISCLHPSTFVKYDLEGKITDYANKLQQETKTKYEFPIKLNSVNSNPVIYYIDPQFVGDDMVPVVRYVTSCSLDDGNALKEEADLMSPVVQQLFPGISDGTSNIVFRAFSEPPTDSTKTYDSYGTVINIKK